MLAGTRNVRRVKYDGRTEQDYFDKAKEALDKAVASRNAPSSAGTAFERRSFDALAKRRQTLGSDEPVAFGRVDFETAEIRYIGKVPIRDAAGDVLVYNWQSPAAEVFNVATIARIRPCPAPRRRAL